MVSEYQEQVGGGVGAATAEDSIFSIVEDLSAPSVHNPPAENAAPASANELAPGSKFGWRSGTVLNMSGVAEANLPFDIRLQILKEYLRLWATRIRTYDEPATFKPTNRAYLTHYHWFENPTEVGWCAVPVNPHHVDNIFAGRHWTDMPHRTAQGCFTNEILIAKILGVCSGSNDFLRPLEAFFFGHMIWCFDDLYDLSSLYHGDPGGERTPVNAEGNKPLPQKALKMIKHISLRPLDEDDEDDDGCRWIGFQKSFWDLYSAITQNGLKFPQLQSLELFIICPENMGLFLNLGSEASDAFKKVAFQILEERIRYLVTRCYQIVQARPRIIICIRTAWTKFIPDRYYIANEALSTASEEARDKEYGFCKSQAEDFYYGTSILLSGLQSVEFGDIDENPGYTGALLYRKIYFQMRFAIEWRKIWEQGLELPEEEGGYAAVYSCDTDYDNDDD